MVGFLGALGSFGSGIAPSINDIANSTSLGNSLAAAYGGAPNTSAPQQQNSILQALSGLGGGLGQAFGGGQQPPQQGPTPQPPMAGTSTPSIPGGVASQGGQGGGGVFGGASGGGQPQPQQPPSQGQPQQPPGMPPPQSAQPSARPMAQQPQPGSGQLDLPTLVKQLTAKGITGPRLGMAVQQLMPLLSQQGLSQYQGLEAQLARERLLNEQTNTQSEIAARKSDRDPKTVGSPAWSRVTGANDREDRAKEHRKEFQTRIDTMLKVYKDKGDEQSWKQAEEGLKGEKVDAETKIKDAQATLNSPQSTDDELAQARVDMREAKNDRNAADDALTVLRRKAPDRNLPKSDAASSSGAAPAGGKAAPEVVKAKEVSTPHVPGATHKGPDGVTYKFKGGDWDALDSWEPVDGQ